MTHSTPSLKHAAAIGGLVVGLLVAVGSLHGARAADARDPIQREDLALIDAQLARIDTVIERMASRQADAPNRRVFLDTERLRADIDAIRAGIQGYLAPPRRLPRRPAPLSGQYREQRAQAGR